MPKTFTNFHLAISRGTFEGLSYRADPSIRLVRRPAPGLQEFLDLLNRVGGRYGWPLRPKYLDYPAVVRRLRSPETRFFDIEKDGVPVGYVFATKPQFSLAWHYTEAAQGRKTIEIENFGLFDGQTGRGYGDTALSLAFGALLKENDNVYLTTRSTNHQKVVPFYEENGMTVLAREVLPDDLVQVKGLRPAPLGKIAAFRPV